MPVFTSATFIFQNMANRAFEIAQLEDNLFANGRLEYSCLWTMSYNDTSPFAIVNFQSHPIKKLRNISILETFSYS